MSKPAREQPVTELAAALMCRLRIPQGTTIVGLLGVGPTRSNHDEVFKWVERELCLIDQSESEDTISELCIRFLMKI